MPNHHRTDMTQQAANRHRTYRIGWVLIIDTTLNAITVSAARCIRPFRTAHDEARRRGSASISGSCKRKR
ncbi:hypothetical protein KCP69_10075 [Salmonella enterica subsp. enterica]|nr:hypothetical protein KCP69_10075 [Salmonella enterica subsp. enterica]